MGAPGNRTSVAMSSPRRLRSRPSSTPSTTTRGSSLRAAGRDLPKQRLHPRVSFSRSLALARVALTLTQPLFHFRVDGEVGDFGVDSLHFFLPNPVFFRTAQWSR